MTFSPVASFSSLPRGEAISLGLQSPVPSQTHMVRGSHRPEQAPLKMGVPSTYRSVNFLDLSRPTVRIRGSLEPLSCLPGVRGGWTVPDTSVVASPRGECPQGPSGCRIRGTAMAGMAESGPPHEYALSLPRSLNNLAAEPSSSLSDQPVVIIISRNRKCHNTVHIPSQASRLPLSFFSFLFNQPPKVPLLAAGV